MDSTPLCYTQLLGQEKAKRLLGRSLANNRLPHGFIFKGPEGVGKGLYARGLAAAINCKDVKRIGACGICSSCKKFRSMNHPDFTVIQPERGVIKIAQIRQLIKEITFPPYESKMRVVVIEDVHTMRREAANSLLKTLEEPPAGNLLILTAESSKEILATLTSRCQVVPFMPLSRQETMGILKQAGVAEESVQLLARLSDGSPGKALLLQETEMVNIWREVILCVSDPAVHPDRDVGTILRLAEKMAALKDDLGAMLDLFRLWIRDLLLAENELVMIFGTDVLLKSWSSEQLFAKLQAIDRAEQELARNCNKNLVCEVLLFKLQ